MEETQWENAVMAAFTRSNFCLLMCLVKSHKQGGECSVFFVGDLSGRGQGYTVEETVHKW